MDDRKSRDRPAKNPGGMVCQDCGEVFIGEEHHVFCGLCVKQIAAKIAAAQGR